MKKLILGFVLVAASVMVGTNLYAASVDNYTITQYDVKMTLERDSENRSTLQTVETITATFPDSDQNHGLERVFVKDYNGHPTSLKVTMVRDKNGANLPYHWSGNALRIGDANTYVHGEKTYVITYTQRDVTRYYADTDKDEFYWDVIGLDWRVPIEKANVELSIDGALKGPSAQPYCYQGLRGSTTECALDFKSESYQEQPGQQTPLVYKTSVENIGNGRGVTIAVGFMKGTFAEYKASLWEQLFGIWGIVQAGLSVVTVGLMAWIIARWNSLTSRKKELGTIVAEYLPSKDVTVTAAARVGGYSTSILTAQLLDLAVRHYIKIYEVKEPKLFSSGEYEIEIIKDISDLKWEEQELLRDTYGGIAAPSVGQRLNLKTLRNNTQYYKRTLNNDSDLDKLIRGEYGLQELDPALKKWLRRLALVFLILSIVLVSPVLIIVSLTAFILSFMAYRLTDKGLALKRYLEGLKMYIKVAEEDRIKMLQSPEGAEKVADVANGTDTVQLVKLYERVLPYAVLFGQEKQWNKQIGAYYEANNSQPSWYASSNGAWNAAAFSSAMSGFTAAGTSVSSASSSTGGSSGGGSAGGGGGGGGGGGW